MKIVLDGKTIDLNTFFLILDNLKRNKLRIILDKKSLKKINTEFDSVKRALEDGKSVYGLNTGLGGNLNYSLSKEEISNFQLQIIEGRAVGSGNYLNENLGLMTLLTRCIQSSRGGTGVSPQLYKFMIDCFSKGFDPAIPEFGSIGAGDLTQNASFGLSLLGRGKIWDKGKIKSSKTKLKSELLNIPKIDGKDAIVIVNHSCLSIALSAQALNETKTCLMMHQLSSLMSIESFSANHQIFLPDINHLRNSPGQKECADWYYKILKPLKRQGRRIQDPLSFRTVAVMIGLAKSNLKQTISIWENELNGITDSPVIIDDRKFLSTPNFHNPGLAVSIESLLLSNTMTANGSVQRMQRLMDERVSDLPKYLSPVGGKSAGFVSTQKTAVSVLAEIKQYSLPIAFDASPVSESVEDMSTMTPACAKKLLQQSKLMKLIAGMECLVASQALDLRYNNVKTTGKVSSLTKNIWKQVRKTIDKIDDDRPMNDDINNCTFLLEEFVTNGKIEKLFKI